MKARTASYKQSLVDRYNQSIEDGQSIEDTVYDIYTLGCKYTEMYLKPITEHNSELLIVQLKAAKIITAKEHKVLKWSLNRLSILNSLHKVCTTDNTIKQNPSGWATISILKEFTECRQLHIVKILTAFVEVGAAIRVKRSELKGIVLIKSKSNLYCYQITPEGSRIIKRLGKQFKQCYDEFNSSERLSSYMDYNYTAKELEGLKILFNTKRDTFRWDAPNNQKLGLIVKNFKERFKPKDD